jgi:hypothetical protein
LILTGVALPAVAWLGESFSMRDSNISKGEQREIKMSLENLHHGFQWLSLSENMPALCVFER